MIPAIRAGRARQSGQALTETAILAVVLVPLFLLIPTLAKLIHVKQTTQQAARSAAWDATVARDYALASELVPQRQRDRVIDWHFNQAEARILTAPTANETRLGNPLLNSFTNVPLVERQDIQLDAYTREAPPGLLMSLMERVPDAAVGVLFPSNDDLVTATVNVSVRDLRHENGRAIDYLPELSGLDLRFTSGHTLLADAWNARGSGVRGAAAADIAHARSTYQRVSPLTAGNYTGVLDNAISAMRPLGFIPILGAPADLKFDMLEDTLDIVPQSKLEPYAPAP